MFFVLAAAVNYLPCLLWEESHNCNYCMSLCSLGDCIQYQERKLEFCSPLSCWWSLVLTFCSCSNEFPASFVCQTNLLSFSISLWEINFPVNLKTCLSFLKCSVTFLIVTSGFKWKTVSNESSSDPKPLLGGISWTTFLGGSCFLLIGLRSTPKL